ncbi:MAG: hypothetical protein LBN97_04665 [Oscillospiraceae bacterium]|jgi:hypothetical protein|nr:hypothetical protein [Oscillospiraceae bacterium]
MTLPEFAEATKSADLLLLECGDVIVYDRSQNTLYSTTDTHSRARMNPMVDFRTMLGHHLLWSRQCELDCTNDDFYNAIRKRPRIPLDETPDYRVWELI